MDPEDDDFEVDPEIAAAMGFTSFGMKPGAKRRKNDDGRFTVTDASSASGNSTARGANSTPLGIRGKGNVSSSDDTQAGIATTAAPAANQEAQDLQQLPSKPAFSDGGSGRGYGSSSAPSHKSGAGLYARIQGKKLGDLDGEELAALSRGVRNEAGDMVYFKPSFVEDPWERLRAADDG
ncbi:hypothetical protein NA57DRAFT_53942 [Rhizodiscina lignyota]|uniref:Uncharacterized protein n=1 Tax=Rhizodiscina lignyota TaxID=1504668 RepID=A0A9P4II75_9PEZI|nr:hypothetical protein NA57DRAFT_53942 [Rhizodiscina lignyota]